MDDTYSIGFRCRNCGETGSLDIPKGTRLEDVECPNCRCKTLDLNSGTSSIVGVNDNFIGFESSSHEIAEDS
jgi:Zn finger protein HypA/HybF involved in hydrogenase expression